MGARWLEMGHSKMGYIPQYNTERIRHDSTLLENLTDVAVA